MQDKHNPIGKWMRATPPEKRESLFMFWQLVYTIVTFSPAVFYLWKSPAWSGAYLTALFAAATWNGELLGPPLASTSKLTSRFPSGANFYVEVWGRKWVPEARLLIVMAR